MSSTDSHIKFDGVEGESTHKDHKGEIEVLSWTWGVSQAAGLARRRLGQGQGDAREFTFIHRYDKASPVLAKYCALGQALQGRQADRAQGRRRPEGLSDGHHEGSLRHGVQPSGSAAAATSWKA